MAERCDKKEAVSENTISILVVEDDLVDRTQLERLLNRSALSAKVTSTDRLEDAIKLLKNTTFDVILLDLRLPDSSGLETLTTLAGNNLKAAIIVTTGEGGEDLGLKAVTIGAQDYLIKGEFNTQILEKAIRYSIERKRTEELLKSSDARLRALFENMSSAVAIYEVENEGDNFIFSDCNQSLLRIEKINREQIIGRRVTEVFPGVEKFGIFEVFQRVYKTGISEHLPARLYEDQRISGWKENYIYKLPSGEIVAIYDDVTDSKLAEEEREKMLFFQIGINSLQQSLLQATPLEERLKKVTDDIVSFFDADFCRIWLIKHGDMCQQGCVHAEIKEGPHVCRHQDKCLHLISSSGRYTHIDGKGHRRVPFGCYKIGLIASAEEHKFLTNDVQNDPRVHNNQWAKELGLVSFAGYQLKTSDGQPLGVMALFSKYPIQPSEDVMLDGISSNVAMAVQQAILSNQLQESEEKYHGLFESSRDAIMTLEPPTWKFTSCNPATLKLFKVDTEDKFTLLGPGDASPVQQPDGCPSADKAKEMIGKAMKEGSSFFEWTHKRINGEDFPAIVLLTRMEQGGKVFLQATVRDITTRKKAEEALLRERNKAKKYLDVAGVLILVLDNGETINRINKKGCDILGYEENETLGKNWCDLFVPPEQKEEVESILKGLMNGETEKYEYHENAVLTKSGEKRLIAWHNVVLWDETGKNYAVLSSGEDITERKAAEIELLTTYKELEKAHREMKGMQSQIVQSEKLASIGQLAAGVAHEINTPVGFVSSNFETLQKYFKKFKMLLEMHAELGRMILTADKTQQTAKLTEINKTATDMKIGFILEDIGALFEESTEGLTRITKIVQNLRDFSRIDQAEAFDEYDLNHGIEATLTVARNAIKYHADVVTEFADIPHIACNASQINQVFLNILVNAAQAIESQHRETNGSIKIKTSSDDTHIICKIIDDGPGIPANIIEKIFDPFFTTKPVGKGTGLGLSVSYDIIVRKHKGELLVNSVIGKGTEFTIKLPIKPAPTAEKHDKETEAGVTIKNYVC